MRVKKKEKSGGAWDQRFTGYPVGKQKQRVAIDVSDEDIVKPVVQFPEPTLSDHARVAWVERGKEKEGRKKKVWGNKRKKKKGDYLFGRENKHVPVASSSYLPFAGRR